MTRVTEGGITRFTIRPTNDPDNPITYVIETIVVEGIEDAFPTVSVEQTLQFVVDEEG